MNNQSNQPLLPSLSLSGINCVNLLRSEGCKDSFVESKLRSTLPYTYQWLLSGNKAMFVYNGKEIETDAQGYLLDHTQWEEGMIELLAKDEEIELTDAHLEVVHFVRDFYEEFNTSPAVRMLVKAMEKAHGPEKGNSKYLFKLFKKGPAKQATKLAGLPKPAKCL